MANDWQQAVRELLETSRIAFLSTIGGNGPETSMAPYAVWQGDVLLHLSRLARHTANIARDPRIGLMICTPETMAESPLALPRISLSGIASIVDEQRLAEGRSAYLQRIPDAEALFSFPDFRLFRVDIQHIHWVGGFGMARSIPRQGWRDLFGVPGN
ncbi:MAG TPA: pyridoxamine 5'-phosphate oxidase family protein [Mariprofundaceae bacterium]|nr:pyridoxamine 5'-phosphate oxidase family protein [Mariprofundaceae bacterium]